MRSAYERRLAEAGARIDEAARRRELDLKSFAGKLNELMSRQGRLESAARSSPSSPPRPKRA